MKKLLFISFSLLILFSSCRMFGGKRIRGDGNVISSERNPGMFSGIESSGSFDIYLSSGPDNKVRVEAEGNLQEYIETNVSNNVLEIRTRDRISIRPRRGIKVYITSPTYTRVRVNGSGDIVSQNKINSSTTMDLAIRGSGDMKVEVDAPEITTEILGSGTARISGTTRIFRGEINGSGDIKAMDLKTEESKVEIRGSGNADVYASVKLNVEVRGSGDVRYSGPANVSSDIAGSGSVRKVD